MNVHQLYNPDNITQYNVVPGLMGVVLTLTMVMMTGLAITRERERGTMENLLAMPSTPMEVMTGKLIPYIGIGSDSGHHHPAGGALRISSAVLRKSRRSLSIGAFVYCGQPDRRHHVLLAGAESAAGWCSLSIFYFLPNILLSGFMFPFKGMPAWAQVIGNLLPLTYFNRLIRGILLKGNGWADSWPSVWPIMVFTLVLMVIAVATYRRTLD